MTARTDNVTFDSILSRSDEVMFQSVGDEAVLLDLASEQYFGLNPVGARIWDLLDGSATLAQVHATLCSEYDSDADRIGDDLLALARLMIEAGLARQD